MYCAGNIFIYCKNALIYYNDLSFFFLKVIIYIFVKLEKINVIKLL